MAPLLLSVCLIAGLHARTVQPEPSLEYYLPGGTNYDETVPTPGSFFGFEPGEWHLRNDQIAAYIRELARISDRMHLVEFGRTHEFKPLYLLHVSSPENLARADEIREARSQSMEAERGDSDPLIVWLAYSVHGNEPSGANSVPLLAYHLAAAQGEEIEQLLRETVILIEPVVNPDGLDRFANWANMHRGRQPVADRDHREHREAWPSGRANHYWFDLNRDWLPLVHPESRGRLEQYHAWRPHLLGDFHEMQTDRTFFFQPGVPSRNNPLTPERNYELTARVAEFNARELDQIGSLYYTEETFDDFYAGKASTYPDLNGSVGILFEQASSRGHVQESEHGLVTFPFTIRNQLRASLGTLRAAVVMGEEFKNYSRWFYESAREEAQNAPVQGYAIAASNDPVRNAEFIDLLRRHQIRVHELAENLTVDGRDYRAGRDFIVPMQQPQSRLIRSYFERLTSFEENVFYDISTWVLPPAFNLDYADLSGETFKPALLGKRIERARPSFGGVDSKSDYGYIFRWNSLEAPMVLQRILAAGLRAKVATKPFTIPTPAGLREFGEGTVFVPVSVQEKPSDDVYRILKDAADGTTVRVLPAETSLTPAGLDLGSPSFSSLEERKVLVVIGEGVSSLGAGYIWHLLDHRVGMEVSLIEASRLRRSNLKNYNVIVLPSGSHSRMSSAAVGALRDWVRDGGTLIAVQGAVRWAVANKFAEAEFAERGKEEPQRLAYADADAVERLKRISGAIFSAHVDSTHPAGFGFENESVTLFRQGTLFLKPAKNPYNTPALYHKEPLVSGYASAENRDLLAESAALIADPFGSGVVFLFADDPAFRGYWLGSSRLFLNAVFFGPVVRNISVSE